MKIISTTFAVLVFMVLSAITVSAQDKQEYTGALLWKVSGNGLEKPSYILGTHHLAHISFVDSVPGLRAAIDNTEQTVGELLMSDQAAMQAKIQEGAMMPAGESYKNMLSAEDYAKLDKGLKDLFSVGLDQFGQLKPGMISMVYTITLYTKFYPGFNPVSHEAIDAYVQRIAKEQNKSVLGLETVEDQIKALFDSEPLKDQAITLACVVGQGESMKVSLDKLNDYYRKGELSKMYDLAFNDPDDTCRSSQNYLNALNKDRNDKWMLKLPQIMKDKSSLVAVGALHLAQKDGILYQLARMGYKVEAVK
ncbi:MAG: TraB/GumN family protein [Dysgonomonas sp.]